MEEREEVFRKMNALEDPCEDSLWYYGRCYEFELRSRTGTPYFFNVGFMPGGVTFNQKLQEDLTLGYNLVTDELVLKEMDAGGNMITLVLNKFLVEEYTLMHHGSPYHFRSHTELDPLHDQMEEGYYEVIHEDELRMYVKHRKRLIFDVTKADPYSYQYDKQVFLIFSENLFEVHSRRDYLRAFQHHRKSLRQYMRRAKINFEKAGTRILFDLCAYSESLLKP